MKSFVLFAALLTLSAEARPLALFAHPYLVLCGGRQTFASFKDTLLKEGKVNVHGWQISREEIVDQKMRPTGEFVYIKVVSSAPLAADAETDGNDDFKTCISVMGIRGAEKLCGFTSELNKQLHGRGRAILAQAFLSDDPTKGNAEQMEIANVDLMEKFKTDKATNRCMLVKQSVEKKK